MSSSIEAAEILEAPRKLGVGLLPERELNNAILQLADLISTRFSLSYNLDGENFIPHVTLFQGKFQGLQPLVDKLKTTRNADLSDLLSLNNIGFFADSFIFVDCFRPEKIDKLHNLIVSDLNPLRIKEAASIGTDQQLSGLKPEEADSIDRYGYPFVKNSFRPHFTLGRIMSGNIDEDYVKKLAEPLLAKYRGKAFDAENVFIYELGIDGSCSEVLEILK